MTMARRLITTAAALFLGVSSIALADEQVGFDENKALPLAELRRFSEVFDRIKEAYVEPVSDKKLLEDAIRGMLSGLDPHSSYLLPEAFKELQVQTSGQFGGVGIEVNQDDGMIRVITPIDDTPAMRAGIKPGDLIVKIDGKAVQSIGLEGAIAMMRGKPGSPIVLSIVRDAAQAPFDITIKRDIIRITSVRSKMLSEGVGYVRITQFQHHTGRDLAKELKRLSDEEPLQGLVLDLRNNPGGVLSGAVEVTDAFVNQGVIVSTKGRLANSRTTYQATAAMKVDDIPLVVLINGGSASASEIVAGALQDRNRAIIMGTASFGKGSVQTVLQLSQDRGVKLTTARYYTPLGRSIQAKGIEPDILVEEASVKSLKREDFLKEQDLNGHLSNDQQEEGRNTVSDLAEQDFQLYEALNLIKGLVIVRKGSSKTG
ncbi:MAG: S41 family peptidase [Pseudomonadales bacterium]